MNRSSRPPFVSAVYEECRAGSGATTSATLNTTHKPAQSATCLGTEGSSPQFKCDLCGKRIDGLPAGSGLLLWHRGDEMRVDEPPLCEKCASRVTIGAVVKWALEGEEEG